MASASTFSLLSDDLLVTIFSRLESDPRHWARLSCVCSRFSSLIRNVCCKDKCTPFPFLHNQHHPPGGWAALRKLSVCCPGLAHAGVLLDNSDFGLELDIGPNYIIIPHKEPRSLSHPLTPTSSDGVDLGWTMFDDLYLDTVYDLSETDTVAVGQQQPPPPSPTNKTSTTDVVSEELLTENRKGKRKRRQRHNNGGGAGAHLATAAWAPSREQGMKLLAPRFRGDSLYVCEWPGCVHAEDRGEYMLFKGVFGDFKRSGVWRTIVDGAMKGSGLGCAFCGCRDTWDLHASFCLRRSFGYHDDGEPVVRAYVCDNGHVSGAWTRMPL